MLTAVKHIRSGRFAEEWTREQMSGYPSFERLRREAFAHPLNEADRAVRQLLEPGRAACTPAAS
jgi:ketol-acid reductoisomerase